MPTRMRLAKALGVIALLTIGCSGPGGASSPAAVAGGSATPSPSADPPASPSATPPAPAVRFEEIARYGPADILGLDQLGYLTGGPDGLYFPNASEIFVLDSSATVIRRWGEPGTGPGQFGFIRDPADPNSALGGVGIAPNGDIYVVEAGNKRVQRFDSAGEFELMWGSPGGDDGAFLDPISIAIAPSGEVLVVDDERDDIQVFDPDGVYLHTIGRHGPGPGELQFTGAIRIDADGTLVNADFGNSRVQAWDATGTPLWTMGTNGTGPGEFVEPQDVAFGPDGILFVVDDARIQAFDRRRELIASWPDEPSPDHLASIALIGDRLWVVAPYIDTLIELRISAPG